MTLTTTCRPLKLWENIVLGGTAAAIAGVAVYPMDTIKARLMNGQGSGVLAVAREIIAKQVGGRGGAPIEADDEKAVGCGGEGVMRLRYLKPNITKVEPHFSPTLAPL